MDVFRPSQTPHREAAAETLGQDPDADEEDELAGSQTIVGTQSARPTQMPRRLRTMANLPSAGQRLAKETVLKQTRHISIEQEPEPESMVIEAIGTFSSMTQRPKFSTLARNDPDSSPTARRIVRLPEQVDELDQAPSQDPIESSDDEGSDTGAADLMLARSIPIAPIKAPIGLSKTRGQKVRVQQPFLVIRPSFLCADRCAHQRQAEAMEGPMVNHHIQLSRQESVASTQDVYSKPVTKKSTASYGKKAKRDRK
jgi:hypothetical protein